MCWDDWLRSVAVVSVLGSVLVFVLALMVFVLEALSVVCYHRLDLHACMYV